MCKEFLTKTIKIPKNVTISKTDDNLLVLEGIQGVIPVKVNENIAIQYDSQYLTLQLTNNNKDNKKYLGLYNSLLKTHLKGITQNFKINLFLNGIGFKVKELEQNLVFKLGYSHDITVSIPENIKVSILNNTNIILYGPNWEKLTQFASNIKRLKKVEPYKGKGILFKNEKVLRKEGKKNKK